MTKKREEKERTTSRRFLYKGHVVKPGQAVRAEDSSGQSLGFFLVQHVWGHHITLSPLLAQDTGAASSIPITVQSEVHSH